MLDGEYPPADATTDFNHPLHASENGTAFDHETTLREHVHRGISTNTSLAHWALVIIIAGAIPLEMATAQTPPSGQPSTATVIENSDMVTPPVR